jgi:hypothetical protein
VEHVMPGSCNLITYFNKLTWHSWGISWLSSLYEFANFQGNVIIVDYGLPQKAINFLEKLNITIIPGLQKFSSESLDFVHTISKINGMCAFWSPSSYFQGDINEVFKKLVYSSGDFWCMSSDIMVFLDGFMQFCIDSEVSGLDLHKLIDLFGAGFGEKDDKWLTVVGKHLKWDNGWVGEHKVISIPESLHFSALSAYYHYRNRYPGLYNSWVSYYKGSALNPNRILRLPRAKT